MEVYKKKMAHIIGKIRTKIEEYREMYYIWRKNPLATFGEISDIWHKQPILDSAVKDARYVLDRDMFMFNEVCNALFSGAPLRKKSDKEKDIVAIIAEEDKRINQYATKIRREVMDYLVENSAPKIEAALVLTSIVIDLERLGDYTKDLAKVALFQPVDIKHKEYRDKIIDYKRTLLEMFENTEIAFKKSDKEKAQLVMDANSQLRADTDKLLLDISGDKKLRVSEVLVYALYTRYFRRVAAHLQNIASSVLAPFPYLGFKIEKDKEAHRK